MRYLNRQVITLDSSLTKKGRELLAQNDGSFRITQFALADDEIEALAEQISREDFFNDPYKLIELDEGVGLDLKAYGNDDVGYALIRDGEKIDLGDTIIRTEGEAQNQMRRIVDDEGLLSDLDGTAKYKSYILNQKIHNSF